MGRGADLKYTTNYQQSYIFRVNHISTYFVTSNHVLHRAIGRLAQIRHAEERKNSRPLRHGTSSPDKWQCDSPRDVGGISSGSGNNRFTIRRGLFQGAALQLRVQSGELSGNTVECQEPYFQPYRNASPIRLHVPSVSSL